MNKIYLVIFTFILFACKSSTVEPSAPQLTLTIYYDSTTAAVGAVVYLFSDQASYEGAITGSEIASTTQPLTTNANGQVTFTQLSPQNYWVYVSYQQNGQTGMAYNNTKTTFSLKNPLTSGSLTQAVIYLKQSPYYITIQPPNTSTYPLNVTVGTNTFTIASYSSTPIYVNVNPGVQQYQALGGAKWSSSFTISTSQSGDTLSNILTKPSNGLIVFWINTKPVEPIFVSITKAADSLATAEQVGSISAPLGSTPTNSAYTTNTAYLYTDYSTYKYKAAMITTGGDSTVYTGTVVLDSTNSFRAIQLPASF